MRADVPFRAKRLFALRAGIAAAALALLASAVSSLADERVERFLPEETLLYVGVEKLGPTADKVFDRLQRGLPSKKDDLSQDRIVAKLAEALKLENVATRADFVAQTGLNLDGSAGWALLWPDPSFPWRDNSEHPNLLVLPIKDRTLAESAVTKRLVSVLPSVSAKLCQEERQRIVVAKREWAAQNPGQPNATPTWEQLAAAHPGFKAPRCPACGELTIGAIGVAPTCSVHVPNWAPPNPPAALESQKIGGVTLVGGRINGTGYAITDSHIILSNDMNVLEDAVQAAAGKRPRTRLAAPVTVGSGVNIMVFEGPRARLAPPERGQAGGEARLFLHVGVLASKLRGQLGRKEVASPAVKRLDDLLSSVGGLTVDACLKGTLFLAPALDVKRSEATTPFLDIPPAKKLAALDLVPDTATAILATNLGRPILSKLGDLALVSEPAIGALVKLTEAGADGDAAFALTRGWVASDVPNMLLILRVRDRKLLNDAAENWFSVLAKQARAESVQSSRVGDCEVWSLEGKRMSFHYAFAGPFAVAGTNLEDVKAAIALQSGAPAKSAVASKEFQALPQGDSNLIAFVNLPRFMDEILARDQAQEAARHKDGPAVTRIRTEGEEFVAGLGLGVLQLRVEGEQLKGEGRLVPVAP